jgi:7,8-dihydropterin-6-yl-methyl-4-(beta-D-ribofuranosyl)aminobenzene 5'-phosphate synthase
VCTEPATADDVRAAMPHPVAGSAADPIALKPVDDVLVTTLVDNIYDALLTSDDTITRAPFAAGTAQAPQFEPGRTNVGLMAEHGFSALVTVRRGDTTTSVLFDTGLSPDAMVTNADRLGLDLSGVHAVVLSHGHFDHAGGLAGLAGRRGTRSLPMVVHPLVWTRRRLALPGRGADDWPTLCKRALAGEGFDVIERRQPSLLAGGSILITGEVDRTTDFEHGMPPAHQHWSGTTWEPDPLILDDQALIMNVRGKGLVIVTGCGHAGAVNIVRHAQRLTGVPRLHALLGGLHLGGPFFTPSIGPTVRALTELAPDLLVPGHCTGWRAQHALAAALPDSWVQGSSGTRYQLAASLPRLTWHLLAAEADYVTGDPTTGGALLAPGSGRRSWCRRGRAPSSCGPGTTRTGSSAPDSRSRVPRRCRWCAGWRARPARRRRWLARRRAPRSCGPPPCSAPPRGAGQTQGVEAAGRRGGDGLGQRHLVRHGGERRVVGMAGEGVVHRRGGSDLFVQRLGAEDLLDRPDRRDLGVVGADYLAVLGPGADDLDRGAVAVDVVGAVLAVVLEDEDGGVLPVLAVRDRVDDLTRGEVVVGDPGLRVRRPAGVVA